MDDDMDEDIIPPGLPPMPPPPSIGRGPERGRSPRPRTPMSRSRSHSLQPIGEMEVWQPPASPPTPAQPAPSGHDVTISSDSRSTSMHPRSGSSQSMRSVHFEPDVHSRSRSRDNVRPTTPSPQPEVKPRIDLRRGRSSTPSVATTGNRRERSRRLL